MSSPALSLSFACPAVAELLLDGVAVDILELVLDGIAIDVLELGLDLRPVEVALVEPAEVLVSGQDGDRPA